MSAKKHNRNGQISCSKATIEKVEKKQLKVCLVLIFWAKTNRIFFWCFSAQQTTQTTAGKCESLLFARQAGDGSDKFAKMKTKKFRK